MLANTLKTSLTAKAPAYRVRVFNRRQRESYGGYVSFETLRVQQLQVKRWWGWQTVDEEIVPEHVLIEIGAMGSSNWKSKFSRYI